MAKPARAQSPRRRPRSVPLSVALAPGQRQRLEKEARRRGLGLSTALRALALERLTEVREEEQLARARRWQRGRMEELYERIRAGAIGAVTEAELEAIFEDVSTPKATKAPKRG